MPVWSVCAVNARFCQPNSGNAEAAPEPSGGGGGINFILHL